MASENTKLVAMKLRDQAKKLNDKIRGIFDSWARKWDDIGELCTEFRDKELFKYCGFNELEKWREDLGIGRATMYRAIRVFESFRELPKPERQKMTQEKAEMLARLPKEDRYKPEWIKRAQDKKLSAEAFEKLIDAHAKKPGKGTSVAEKRIFYKVKGYKSQIQFIEEVVKEWAKNNGLKDDYGRALELICAEVRSTEGDEAKSVLAAISGGMQRFLEISKEIQGIKASDKPADEQLAAIFEKNEQMVLMFAEISKGFGPQLRLEGEVHNKKKAKAKTASK